MNNHSAHNSGFFCKEFFITSSNLLKSITLKFGIYAKFKMESAFCMYNVKHSDFVCSFADISDFKLAPKTKIKKA